MKLDKVTGTILEDLSASWLSGYVGKLFPRWPGYSQKRAYADLCDDAICWACVCLASVSGCFWRDYLEMLDRWLSCALYDMRVWMHLLYSAKRRFAGLV